MQKYLNLPKVRNEISGRRKACTGYRHPIVWLSLMVGILLPDSLVNGQSNTDTPDSVQSRATVTGQLGNSGQAAKSIQPIPERQGDGRTDECNVLGVIVTANRATITRARPSMTVGPLFSASGSFAEKPVDSPCDPGQELGPFPVSSGGKLVARLEGNPPAPNRLSLGNSGTGLKIVFEPELGDGNFGPEQEVLAFAIPAEMTTAEMSGTWPGPGRLRAYTSAPGGNAPLTTMCYPQTFTATAEITEVAESGPVQSGMRLFDGDRISTEATWGSVLVQGSNVFIGPESVVEYWGHMEQLVPVMEGTADINRGKMPVQFDQSVDKLARVLNEIKKGGYLLPVNTDLVDYGVPIPGIDAESVAQAGLDVIDGIKDPCVAALELKLFLDAVPQGFRQRSANMAVDVAAIWLLPNDWDLIESWGKAKFGKMPGVGLISTAQNSLDTWNRVKQDFVPTVATEKGGWILSAYERFKKGKWTEEQIVADQRRLQLEGEQALGRMEELHAAFEFQVAKMQAEFDREITRINEESFARFRETRRVVAEKDSAGEFIWWDVGQQLAYDSVTFARIEAKRKWHELEMNLLGRNYEAAVSAKLLEVARLQTERQALEAYALPLVKKDCPEIKPLKAAGVADPCTARNAAVMGLKLGTVRIIEGRFGPWGKAIAQTFNKYAEKLAPSTRVGIEMLGAKYLVVPKGTDYSVEKREDSATVRVFDGEVDVLSSVGNVLTVKAGQSLELPAGTITPFQTSQADIQLVGGIPLADIPLDFSVDEPYGTQKLSITGDSLPDDWVWQEPNSSLYGPGDATLEVIDSQTLRITTPNDNDFWGHRCDAPRLLHKVTGDFDLEADMLQECAGLNYAFSQFIIFTPTSPVGYLHHQMNGDGIKSNYFITGGGWMRYQDLNKLPLINRKTMPEYFDAPDGPIRVRMSRRGNQIKTYWSLDKGETWTLSGRHDLTLPETMWAGWVFKRMAHDGLHAEPAVTILRDIRLTTSPLQTKQQNNWDIVSQHGSVFPFGNEVFMMTDGSTPGYVQAYSPWPVTGDFELVVRYDSSPIATQAGEERLVHVAVTTNDERNHAYVRHVMSEKSRRYDSDMGIREGWYRYHRLDTDDEFGRMRLTRNKGILTSSIWKDGAWVTVADWNDGFTEPVYIDLRFQWNTAKPSAQTVRFTIEKLLTENGLIIGASDSQPSGTPTETPLTPGMSDESKSAGLADSGLTIHDVGEPEVEPLHISAPAGAVVTAVKLDSPASVGGLQPGDVIVGSNGIVINTVADFEQVLRETAPSEPLILNIHRGRRAITITMPRSVDAPSTPSSISMLPPLPAGDQSAAPKPSISYYGRHQQPPLIGIWAVSAGSEEARRFGVESPLGAVLTQVQPGSAAQQSGLKPGDLLLQFGQHEVSNYEDLEIAMLSYPLGGRVDVSFVRGDSRQSIQLVIGAGPANRLTYNSYKSPDGTYELKLPASWKITKSNDTPANNINAHDLISSRDGNYRLHCYLVTKPVPNAEQALGEFMTISRRDLGTAAVVARNEQTKVPTAMAAMPYQADQRQVMLYRVAFVVKNQLCVIDTFAPILSDPQELTNVLKSVLSTVTMP